MIAATCLATVLYLEARGEGPDGMRWVADVVLTRAEQSGQSVCEVAAAPGQFAYQADLRPREPEAWRVAVRIAQEALHQGAPPNGPTHFHEATIRPDWSAEAVLWARIGGHVFYKDE